MQLCGGGGGTQAWYQEKNSVAINKDFMNFSSEASIQLTEDICTILLLQLKNL